MVLARELLGAAAALLVLAGGAQGMLGQPAAAAARELGGAPRWLALVDIARCDEVRAEVPRIKARVEATAVRTVDRSRGMRIASTCVVAFEGSALVAGEVGKLPGVRSVEADAKVQVLAEPPSWGLNRLDQPSLPLSSGLPFREGATGKQQTVYVVDTGINWQHRDFGGRASAGPDFSDDANGVDGHGHGTHTAGTTSGTRFGVARDASVIGVKVLDASGSGSTSGVIAGIEWAVRNASGKAAVISMSLGGGASASMDAASKAASSAGMIVVVAAGNDSGDACKYSPARAGGKAKASRSVVTVGATTIADARASYSNYGSCVDIFAPGSDITSLWIGSDSATNTISGTSMATPHVAGVAATLLELYAGNKAQAMAALFALAVPGKVTDNKTPKANVLLQATPDTSPPTPPTPEPTPEPTAPTPAPTPGPAVCVGVDCFEFLPSAFNAAPLPADGVVGGTAVEPSGPDAGGLGCAPLTNDYTGKVLLIQRGTCTFQTKVMHAEDAGAVAVILYMASAAAPIAPAADGDTRDVAIPSVMISFADGVTATSGSDKLALLGNNAFTPAPTAPATPRPSTQQPTTPQPTAPSQAPSRRPTPRRRRRPARRGRGLLPLDDVPDLPLHAS
jgi:hypothetical protein